MLRERLEQALENWQEKLAEYEYEKSLTASKEKEFELKKKIEECNREIERLKENLKSSSEDWKIKPGASLSSTPAPNQVSVSLKLEKSCTPFQVPPLPSYFVARPEVSRDIKSFLLEATVTTGTLVVSAIHGLGGIGKSTLAAALAHESDVLAHFPDGIFWATLGQQPDVLSLLTSWVQALGEYNFRPTNIDAASRHLCSLLHKKAALLVVDDVWDVGDAFPFRVGGSQCRILITTRNADVARVLSATLYNLDVMTKGQALALLEGRIKRNFSNVERRQAQSLAEAVEYLPLALELAAAQVIDGISWFELLADLQAEIARLDALDLPGAEEATDEITRKKLSLLASFNLSLRRLSEEKRHKFAWLGVVPEDVTLTQGMVTTLWEIDARKARDTLRYLRDKALLLDGVPLADGTRTYRLHDLLHDLSRHLLTSSPIPEREEDLPGFGLTLLEAHASMLERYRKRTKNSLWYQLPDDGYIHPYLTWHMEQAGWEDELHALLKEETAEGQNGWYQARNYLGQTAGYLADVTRAWKLAEKAFTKYQCSSAISLQVRYALITSSLNSLAKNIPPALLVALVEKKVWTATQGLAYARQTPDPAQQAEALVMLAPHLPEAEQNLVFREAVTAVQKIQDECDLPPILAFVSYYLPEQSLREALMVARSIKSDWWYEEAVVAIAPNLPKSLIREILTAKQISNNSLIKLAPYLPEDYQDQAYQEILLKIRDLLIYSINFKDVILTDIVKVVSALTSFLPESMQQEGKDKIQMLLLDSNSSRTRLDLDRDDRLLRMMLKPNSLRRTKLDLDLDPDFVPDDGQADILKVVEALASFLPESMQQQVNEKIQMLLLDSNSSRTRLDLDLNDGPRNRLDRDLLNLLANHKIQQNITQQKQEVSRVFRNKSQLQDDLIQAWVIRDKVHQAKLLADWNSKLLESFIKEMIVVKPLLHNEQDWAETLVVLAPYLSEPLLCQVIASVQSIKNEEHQITALLGLIPHLCEEPLQKRVLIIAQAIKKQEFRQKVLVSLIPKIPQPLQNDVLQQLLTEIKAVQWDQGEQVDILMELAIALVEPFKNNILNEALKAAQKIENISAREQKFLKLSRYLPTLLREKKQVIGREVDQDFFNNLTTVEKVELALHSSEPELEQYLDFLSQNYYGSNPKPSILAPYLKTKLLLEKALTIARNIKPVYDRLIELASIAAYLPELLREKVLREEVLAVIKSKDLQLYEQARETLLITVLTKIACCLPNSLLEDALTVTRAIKSEWHQVKIMMILAQYNLTLLEEALEIAWTIKTQERRADALIELYPHLPEGSKVEALGEALALAQIIQDPASRTHMLTASTSYLTQLPPMILYQLWCKTLHNLARRTRKDLLGDLHVLTPVITMLSGLEVIEENAYAVFDVGRWWK